MFAAITVLGVSLYLLWQENQRLKDATQIALGSAAQNAAALQDSLEHSAAVLQTMAVRVQNLNTTIAAVRREYRVLETKYVTLIASVQDVGSGVVVDGADSMGEFRQVTFSGHKSIARYSGYTWAYLTPLSNAKWVVNIEFDTVRTTSILMFDNESKLFQIRTRSLTDGVTVVGYSTLDSAAYPILYRGVDPVGPPVEGHVFVGGIMSNASVSFGGAIRTPRWLFLLNYQVFNHDLVDPQLWYDRVQVGIYYSLF